MHPSAAVTRCASSAWSVIPSLCCAKTVTSLSLIRARRTSTTRDKIVGSRALGSAAVVMMIESAGGSSSAFKSAFAATSVPSCGMSRSASPRMKTLRVPVAGVFARRLDNEFDLLVRVDPATAFSQLQRHKPVHVWMLQRQHEPAGAALAARLLGRARCLAVDQLGEPKRETLLSDASGAGKQQRLW